MRNVLVGTAAALGIAFASAGGALAIEVNKEVTVKAAPADVWKKIGGWCSIRNWHPVIETCEMSEVDGDTWRMLTTGDGGKIKEKRTAEGDLSYGYVITESPLPVANYNATIGVEADEDGTMTKITWNANFDAKGVSDEEAQKTIKGVFDAGLNSVKESMN